MFRMFHSFFQWILSVKYVPDMLLESSRFWRSPKTLSLELTPWLTQSPPGRSAVFYVEEKCGVWAIIRDSQGDVLV